LGKKKQVFHSPPHPPCLSRIPRPPPLFSHPPRCEFFFQHQKNPFPVFGSLKGWGGGGGFLVFFFFLTNPPNPPVKGSFFFFAKVGIPPALLFESPPSQGHPPEGDLFGGVERGVLVACLGGSGGFFFFFFFKKSTLLVTRGGLGPPFCWVSFGRGFFCCRVGSNPQKTTPHFCPGGHVFGGPVSFFFFCFGLPFFPGRWVLPQPTPPPHFFRVPPSPLPPKPFPGWYVSPPPPNHWLWVGFWLVPLDVKTEV